MATGTALNPAPVPPINQSSIIALARVRVAAKWFYWIAALSMINSAVMISGGNFHFVVGLGITSIVDAVAKPAGSLGSALDLVINAFIAGVFALFGFFAVKAQKWAFVTGMALYALDGVLCLIASDYLSAGFHAYALYSIYRGLANIEQAQPAIEAISRSAAQAN